MSNSVAFVWITLESTRHDHTSLSDYKRDTTPSLRQIAAQRAGNRFGQCIAHGKWTGTSSASILTGTHPPTHGLYGGSDHVLSDDLKTVPELLPDDYTSLSLIANPNAGPAKDLDRGFDDVRLISPSRLREDVGLRTMGKTVPQLWSHGGGLTLDLDRHKGLSSYMIVDMAKRFIATQNDPYFLYVHFNSSHQPYLPPAAYVDKFTDGLSVRPKQALDIVQSRYDDIYELIAKGGLSADEQQTVEAMYDAVLSHLDHCVGQLVEAIRQQDAEPIIVITADHGDLLGEYGLVAHKFVVDDALIHVPLVTYGLDGIDDQTDEVVQHIDVLKTALSQIGVEDDQLEGTDLTRNTRQFAVSQRVGTNARQNLEKLREYNPEYELPIPHQQTLTSFRSTDYKLLYSEDDVELFALPDESTDVKDQYPEVFAKMKATATSWLDEHPISAAPEREQPLDPDIEAHLADMGYLT